MDTAVEARGLKKVFGGETAVDGLDLSVGRGEIFGLVGPDGAGKTTTFRMLSGIMIPDGGEARVAGFDVLRETEKMKRRIGYMSQRFSLYGDLTVDENLSFFADIYHVPKAERAEKRRELLDFSRLGPFVNRLAQNLSGGMKQKLALSCTLIHTPEILFLDEPTTGVDPVSRRELWKILQTLIGRGMTLVVSTPYMDEAERCDRVALINRGRIIVCDTPANLKKMMKGDILEVVCGDHSRIKEILSGAAGVTGVQTFGDRLHVQVDSAEKAVPVVEKTLASAGVEACSVRQIEPGLEDVFVAMLSR